MSNTQLPLEPKFGQTIRLEGIPGQMPGFLQNALKDYLAEQHVVVSIVYVGDQKWDIIGHFSENQQSTFNLAVPRVKEKIRAKFKYDLNFNSKNDLKNCLYHAHRIYAKYNELVKCDFFMPDGKIEVMTKQELIDLLQAHISDLKPVI